MNLEGILESVDILKVIRDRDHEVDDLSKVGPVADGKVYVCLLPIALTCDGLSFVTIDQILAIDDEPSRG